MNATTLSERYPHARAIFTLVGAFVVFSTILMILGNLPWFYKLIENIADRT